MCLERNYFFKVLPNPIYSETVATPRRMPEGSRIVRFATFEVDLNSGELRRQGVRIRLPEQAFQVLSMLLNHPGEIVSREDLRDRLWGGQTFVDFDHGLNKAINRHRKNVSHAIQAHSEAD